MGGDAREEVGEGAARRAANAVSRAANSSLKARATWSHVAAAVACNAASSPAAGLSPVGAMTPKRWGDGSAMLSGEQEPEPVEGGGMGGVERRRRAVAWREASIWLRAAPSPSNAVDSAEG